MIRLLVRRRSQIPRPLLCATDQPAHCFGKNLRNAVPAIFPRWAFSCRSGQSGIFSHRVQTTRAIRAASYNANVDPAFNTPSACRAGACLSQLCQALHRDICQHSGSSVGPKRRSPALQRAHPCRYKIHEQAILSLIRPIPSPRRIPNTMTRSERETRAHRNPFNFRADYGPAQTDQRHRFNLRRHF